MKNNAIILSMFVVLVVTRILGGGASDFMFATRHPALVSADAISRQEISVFVPYSKVREDVSADAKAFADYFEARNKAANAMLLPSDEGGRTLDVSLPYEITLATCPACNGIGETLDMKEPDMGQYKGRMEKPKILRKKCPVCNGSMSPMNIRRLLSSGNAQKINKAMSAIVWRAYIQIGRLDEFITVGYNEFVKRHRAAGDVAVGMAFVPREVFETANRKDLKIVEEVFGKPCQKCKWSGIEECKKCKGDGAIPCPNKECKDGWVVTTEVEKKRNYHQRNSDFHRINQRRAQAPEIIERKHVRLCSQCGGFSFVLCSECKGLRAKQCSKCRGLGTKIKR